MRLELRPHAPKAGALPTAQHPDMKLWDCPGVSSQSRRATNCATPGYLVFLHDTMQRKKKQVFRVCGQCCGQARFFGSFSTEEFPPQATVPRTSGISLSREWIGHLSSQSKRATNCATSGYLFLAEKRNFAVPVKIPAEHGQGHRGMYAGGDMLTGRFQYHSMEEKKKQGFPPADHSRLEKAGSANKKAAHAGRQPCRTLRKYAAKAGGEVSGPGSKRDEPKDLCSTQGMRDLGYQAP